MNRKQKVVLWVGLAIILLVVMLVVLGPDTLKGMLNWLIEVLDWLI